MSLRTLRKRVLILLCLCSILIGGCEFRDIDLRLFIVAMGVDVVEDRPEMLRYTFKIAVPTGDPKSGELKSIIIQQDSSSVARAVREIKSKVDKELDFAHCRVLLLGEAYARKGIRDVEEWIIRRRDTQLIMYPAVAVPDARTILNVSPATERIAGNAKALALSEEGTESPYIAKTYLFDVDRRVRESGIDPYMPVITVDNKEEGVLNINKTALMDKERVKLMLEPEESKLLNVLMIRDLLTDLGTTMNGSSYEMNVDRSRARFKIVVPEPGKEEIQYKLKISGNLEEKEDYDQLTHSELKELEQAFNESLSQEVTKLLEKIRETGTDPLGFGLRYFATHWNNNTEKQQWEAMYPHITFKVEVDTQIKGTGYSR
ncbi:Ger(x)C family spore germination protein [Paenibacillus sp. F411]|uniref:Ger(x)C family spore germination protein n=1 Tax=Paenibacillus sp. F411 TaxID=2820239 RepID=UPI00326774A8